MTAKVEEKDAIVTMEMMKTKHHNRKDVERYIVLFGEWRNDAIWRMEKRCYLENGERTILEQKYKDTWNRSTYKDTNSSVRINVRDNDVGTDVKAVQCYSIVPERNMIEILKDNRIRTNLITTNLITTNLITTNLITTNLRM